MLFIDARTRGTRGDRTHEDLADAEISFHVQVRGEVLDVEENQEHLEREARLEGVFILLSSAAGLDPPAIVTAYKQLLRVERAFRSLKSFLRVQPALPDDLLPISVVDALRR